MVWSEILCVLGLMANSAVEVVLVDPIAGGGNSELLERLESSSPDERRSAVKALAKIGDRSSWKLVLGALGDSSGKVADQAQLALGELNDEHVLGDLIGKRGLRSKDPALKRRAAEVIGRVELAVDGPDLVKGLSDRDDTVRRRLLWSFERLAKRERLEGNLAKKVVPPILRKWKGDRNAGVRAAALLALNAIDGGLALELAREALKDRRVEVRCAALIVAGAHPELASELGLRMSQDESPTVRTLLIELQETIGTRDAARALVRCLETESRLRLRWSALEALRRISGMRYRLKLAPWRAWADRLPRDWHKSREVAPEIPPGATKVFGGMPLLTDRVAFLFDMSGSLWNKREDGTTRKQYADRQLRLALGSLPEGSMFNIIPYTDRSHPWRDELVEGSERNLARAYEDFESCSESGQGNFYDAALLALLDPQVDTIMVLTDGAPTGGEIWSLDLMMPMLIEQNRFRRVRFDMILVDAPKGLHRHWKKLAEGTGGRVVAVEADRS